MNNCYCDDETKTKNYNCVICNQLENKLMNTYEREYECCKKITLICGLPEFICVNCRKSGWYSTAEWGGPTQHINKISGVEISIPYKKFNDNF